jgi:hypothetical protein
MEKYLTENTSLEFCAAYLAAKIFAEESADCCRDLSTNLEKFVTCQQFQDLQRDVSFPKL